MAVSKLTYECYRCRDAGFPGVRVYLDGKTEAGKTIYRNEDLTPHQHRQPSNQQQVQSTQQRLQSQTAIWDIVNSKLDKILSLLEKEC